MAGSSMLPYLWMLGGSFSFSVMGALAHEAGQRCEWQVVALFRSLLVLLFVGGYAVASGVPLVFWRPRILWMRSLAGSVSLVGSFYALTRLPVSTVLTLTNTFPIWVAILSWPMLGVPPSGRVWLAVLSGIAGLWLVKQPQGEGPEMALLIALSSALATAVAMLGLHKLHRVDPRAVVVHFALVATLFCSVCFFTFPLTAGAGSFWDSKLLLLLVGIGVTASIGQLFLTKAFTTGNPAKVAVIGLTQVVFALLLDLSQDHEFDRLTLLGMALIIAPTAWVMRRTRVVDEVTEPGV